MNRQQQLAKDLRDLADMIDGGNVHFQNVNIIGMRGKNMTGTTGVATIHSPRSKTLDGSNWQSDNTLNIRLSQ